MSHSSNPETVAIKPRNLTKMTVNVLQYSNVRTLVVFHLGRYHKNIMIQRIRQIEVQQIR